MITSVLVLTLSACHKKDYNNSDGTPECIRQRIAAYSTGAPCDQGASVKLYHFQGMDVYAFDPGSCGADLNTDIYDAHCNYLGTLGGIAGNMHINGVVFYNVAVYVSTAWFN